MFPNTHMFERITHAQFQARELSKELWKDGKGPILLMVSFSKLVESGTRSALPPLLPQLKLSFSLSNTEAGLIISVLSLSFATAQFPGGVLADRIGERNILVVSALISGGSLLIVTFAPIFPVFLLGLAALGVGTGLFGTTRITVASDIFPDLRGTAIGIIEGIGNIGRAVIPPVAGIAGGLIGWRIGIGFLIPWFIITAIGLWLVVPKWTSSPASTIENTNKRFDTTIFRRIINRRSIMVLIAMALISIIYGGYTSFFPTYLVEIKGFSQTTASLLFGIYYAVGIVVLPLAGGAGDRYGKRLSMAVIILITAVSLFAMVLFDTLAMVVLITILLGIMIGFWPIIFTYIMALFPEEIQGSAVGLLRTLTFYIGASGPIIVGTFADAGMFNFSFFFLSLCALGALGVVILLPSIAN